MNVFEGLNEEVIMAVISKMKHQYNIYFTKAEWRFFKSMQEFSGMKGSELIRSALKFYDSHALSVRSTAFWKKEEA